MEPNYTAAAATARRLGRERLAHLEELYREVGLNGRELSELHRLRRTVTR